MWLYAFGTLWMCVHLELLYSDCFFDRIFEKCIHKCTNLPGSQWLTAVNLLYWNKNYRNISSRISNKTIYDSLWGGATKLKYICNLTQMLMWEIEKFKANVLFILIMIEECLSLLWSFKYTNCANSVLSEASEVRKNM